MNAFGKHCNLGVGPCCRVCGDRDVDASVTAYRFDKSGDDRSDQVDDRDAGRVDADHWHMGCAGGHESFRGCGEAACEVGTGLVHGRLPGVDLVDSGDEHGGRESWPDPAPVGHQRWRGAVTALQHAT